MFDSPWVLDSAASNIHFQSVKSSTNVESSSFATFTGTLAPNGSGEIRVALESVDTKIDLRNVRMRFLFFETFRFPEAIITLRVTPEDIKGLAQSRRKTITLPFTMDLHGVKADMTAELVMTLLTNKRVSVASAAPISVPATTFGLTENIAKLEQAAGGITVIPSATVTFDFLFDASIGNTKPATLTATRPGSAALETTGAFDREACLGRFEILSRTGNIYFRSGSARLDDESLPLLTGLLDIVVRCPDLTTEAAGHTDFDVSDATNTALSEARAQQVADFLIGKGVSAKRLVVRGYGESRPVAPNTTAAGKKQNRRIEFLVPN